jgi:two-component system, cell cycle sensor histidine kinase and response regulator CckA
MMSVCVDPKKRPLVVVADDDITVRLLAREYLEKAGFLVEDVETGRDAVERVRDLRPDAIMLDVVMPEMDGLEACRQIRAMPGNENIPVLMMTARDDAESINAAYTAGASEYTAKPVNWTIEVYRLQNMLRFSSATRQVDLARREWERTFNVLDELIMVLDLNMTIVQANNAVIANTSTPMSNVLGRSCREVFCATEDQCDQCPIQTVWKSEEKITFEWENHCLEGTFLVSAFPVFDTENELARVVCLAKDITERKRLDDELRCAQKMDAIGTLSGGLAHDFNNLLQIVAGYSEIGLMDVSPEDPLAAHLNVIRDAAKRGSGITRQLMAVSRHTESRPEPVRVNDLVSTVVQLLKRTFEKMISIKLRLDPNVNWVNADSTQMEQVIMNLAVNAQHAMPEGGSLYFETHNLVVDEAYHQLHPNIEMGPYVEISVTDSGCGIDEAIRGRIFEPFFSTRTTDKGSGLGLSMVYGIVQRHGGQTLCYSEKGIGTTFKILLPASSESVETSDVESSVDYLSIGGDEVILLVDDEPDIRKIAKTVLLHAGYRVLMAANGQEALDLYEKESGAIDFVVMDLNMPVMGGLECLDRLRARGATVPVLLASGFALNDESRKRMSDQTVDYLNKPYQAHELHQKVRSLLNQCAGNRMVLTS